MKQKNKFFAIIIVASLFSSLAHGSINFVVTGFVGMSNNGSRVFVSIIGKERKVFIDGDEIANPKRLVSLSEDAGENIDLGQGRALIMTSLNNSVEGKRYFLKTNEELIKLNPTIDLR